MGKKNYIPYMPLWHNTLVNIEYRKNWESKGYHIVDDIISNNGFIYTENELKDRGLKINFLDYAKLKYSIKQLEIKTELYKKHTGPRLPGILFYIGLTSKGCNKTYNRLMKYDGNIIKEVKDKWDERLNEDIKYETVEQAFMELPKCKESAYQKYLQFKLLHHRTAINEKLYTMKLSDTNLCQICKTSIETIEHSFLECSSMISLWRQIENWISLKIKKATKLTAIDKIFGRLSSDEIIDRIILCTKTVIFNNRKKGKLHQINDVKRALFRQLRIEEYKATLSTNDTQFVETWDPVYSELYSMYSA